MTTNHTSRWPGFFRLSPEERIQRISKRSGLRQETSRLLTERIRLPLETADHMIENCIGTFELPMGLGINLRVDGRDRVVPMVIEEPSVVAGLSKASRMVREGDGVRTRVDEPLMIGQIQLVQVPDMDRARAALEGAREALLGEAAAVDPLLLRLGGGPRELELRELLPDGDQDPEGPMLVVHLLVDVRDAMGANVVNSMVERIAPRVAELTGGRPVLRILSNLADRRLAHAEALVPVSRLAPNGGPGSGAAVARTIQQASVMAERDPYRAATHNKGVMNGIDAVLLATGQDWRAAEAGAHAHAARDGRYRSMTRWRLVEDRLEGEITIPLALGTVGGVVKDHPVVRAAMDLLEVQSASDLASVVAATGLIQNLAALHALATEGIQRGHMRLHYRKLGLSVGAKASEMEPLIEAMRARGGNDPETAYQILTELREGRRR